MPIILRRCLPFILFLIPALASAQSVDVTFRYVPPPEPGFTRVFLPGEFNGWGPNSSGTINIGAPSEMMFLDSLNQWIYQIPLNVGQTYSYKVHFHRNASGSDWEWITDPLNPISDPADNNNSVLQVADPMVFQPAHELNADGLVAAVSAGIFGTQPINTLMFEVNGVEQDGLTLYDPANGIFRYVLPQPIAPGSQFKVTATDAIGREVTSEIGTFLEPVAWETEDFATVRDVVQVRARASRPDGTIDPTLTTAELDVNGTTQQVAVNNGRIDVEVMLGVRKTLLQLRVLIDGQTFASEVLTITRRVHPLDVNLVDPNVAGTAGLFQIEARPTAGVTLVWAADSVNSTTGIENLNINGNRITGNATGTGELYFNLTATGPGGQEDFRRVAVIMDAEGNARQMGYAETPSWVNGAVVYEIFPLTFGPEATGTEAQPGRRFQEITAELPYIAEMGFNVIWFMPPFHNQFMDPISGGYNIIDFYNVDPKLGTNDDFKALVEAAHDLGIKIILDITPNHVSPIHPWVEALRNGGPQGRYVQTTPSAHNRGLDNRGANLREVWQTEGGRNLYRKYDGFGDLANLDWDDDDLQAAFLDIFAYWVREFDIDGWRFDVYWGPWRRYGPERFGRPIRDLMKRIKPDTWLLGELAGTGTSTEVYYTDAERGSAVVGGLDAAYDWNFYFDGIQGNYGNLRNYDRVAHNGDFYPGPNARYFRFLENHDEPRIAKEQRAVPERILPLTGLLMTTTGIPMVYQGQEVNFGNISGDERRRPVTWSTERNGLFARLHQQLIHARRQFPAFWTQAVVTLNLSGGVYVYARPYLDENAVVLINFSDTPQTLNIDPTSAVELTTDGPISYTHLFADSTFVDAELDGFSATLAPYETAVFIAHGGQDLTFEVPPLPTLPYGAVYTASETETLPDAFALEGGYPNPFTRQTTIRYNLPEPGDVRLDVFDVLGRCVATLAEGRKAAGANTAVWRPVNLPAGTYLYRLKAGNWIQTRKMVLIR